ncbi:unnamed protein product [Victoria cruziana]
MSRAARAMRCRRLAGMARPPAPISRWRASCAATPSVWAGMMPCRTIRLACSPAWVAGLREPLLPPIPKHPHD